MSAPGLGGWEAWTCWTPCSPFRVATAFCDADSPSRELRLFVPERFNRIEASSLVGRVQSEEQADYE